MEVAGRPDPDTRAATPPRAGLYAPGVASARSGWTHPDLRNAIGWATEAQAQPRTVDTLLFSTALLVASMRPARYTRLATQAMRRPSKL